MQAVLRGSVKTNAWINASPDKAKAALAKSGYSAEKPANTTEWTAPIRAQASMAIAASRIFGR